MSTASRSTKCGCVWSWATQTDGAADFGDDKRWARDRRDVEMLSGGLLLRNKIDWPFVEPTLVTAHYPRIEAVAAGGLISAAVGARPHGAADALAPVLRRRVFEARRSVIYSTHLHLAPDLRRSLAFSVTLPRPRVSALLRTQSSLDDHLLNHELRLRDVPRRPPPHGGARRLALRTHHPRAARAPPLPRQRKYFCFAAAPRARHSRRPPRHRHTRAGAQEELDRPHVASGVDGLDRAPGLAGLVARAPPRARRRRARGARRRARRRRR